MSMQKIWTSVSTTPSSLPWGNTQVYQLSSVGDNSLVNLYEGSLIIRMNFTGLANPGSTTVAYQKPAITWITQVQATGTYFVDVDGRPEERSLPQYAAYSLRGVAGYILQIMEYSSKQFDNNASPCVLTPANSTSVKTQREVVIPLRFLLDIASENKFISFKQLNFTVTWDSAANIFTTSDPSPAFQPNVQNILFNYPTFRLTDMTLIRKELRILPARRIFIQPVAMASGVDSITTTVTVPFALQACYYMQLLNSNGSFSFTPNTNSFVTLQQLTSGDGIVVPSIPQYNTIYNSTSEVGLDRLFTELIDISGKNFTGVDSILSYENWRDTYRIYALETGVTQGHTGFTWNLAVQFSSPTTVACTLMFVFLGKELMQ